MPDGRPVPLAGCISYNHPFMLRYFTAGESHGEALIANISGGGTQTVALAGTCSV